MTDKDWALKFKTHFLVWKTRVIENIHLKNAISHSETLPYNCDFVIDLSKHIMNSDKKNIYFLIKILLMDYTIYIIIMRVDYMIKMVGVYL